MGESFTCEHCGAGFKHPEVIGEDGKLEEECATVDGRCEHLMNAGWRPVWVRVFTDTGERRERHLFTRGGWICPACVKQLNEPGPIRPTPRRYARSRP